jgi:hypothetical protein
LFNLVKFWLLKSNFLLVKSNSPLENLENTLRDRRIARRNRLYQRHYKGLTKLKRRRRPEIRGEIGGKIPVEMRV